MWRSEPQSPCCSWVSRLDKMTPSLYKYKYGMYKQKKDIHSQSQRIKIINSNYPWNVGLKTRQERVFHFLSYALRSYLSIFTSTYYITFGDIFPHPPPAVTGPAYTVGTLFSNPPEGLIHNAELLWYFDSLTHSETLDNPTPEGLSVFGLVQFKSWWRLSGSEQIKHTRIYLPSIEDLNGSKKYLRKTII